MPGSSIYLLLPKEDIPNEINVWMNMVSLEETFIERMIEKEVELRRMRLGANSLVVIRQNVEAEIILGSDVPPIYVLNAKVIIVRCHV